MIASNVFAFKRTIFKLQSTEYLKSLNKAYLI